MLLLARCQQEHQLKVAHWSETTVTEGWKLTFLCSTVHVKFMCTCVLQAYMPSIIHPGRDTCTHSLCCSLLGTGCGNSSTLSYKFWYSQFIQGRNTWFILEKDNHQLWNLTADRLYTQLIGLIIRQQEFLFGVRTRWIPMYKALYLYELQYTELIFKHSYSSPIYTMNWLKAYIAISCPQVVTSL